MADTVEMMGDVSASYATANQTLVEDHVPNQDNSLDEDVEMLGHLGLPNNSDFEAGINGNVFSEDTNDAMDEDYGNDDQDKVVPLPEHCSGTSRFHIRGTTIIFRSWIKYRSQKFRLEELCKALTDREGDLAEYRSKMSEAYEARNATKMRISALLADIGISEELHQAFEQFTQSLSSHGAVDELTWCQECRGLYSQHEPDLKTFRRYGRNTLDASNFRCDSFPIGKGIPKIYITTFCRMQPHPHEMDVPGITWGAKYRGLYTLAKQAARNGSDYAFQLLVSLPDIDGSYQGGWLFEYEEDLAVGTKFCLAHNINAPLSEEAKRQQVMLMLGTVDEFRS